MDMRQESVPPAVQAEAFPPPAVVPAVLVGRMPITDVSPTVLGGRRPAAAAVGEAIPIRATCLREGHDALGAHAVLIDPTGREHSRVRMTAVLDGLDTWQGLVRPDSIGLWQFVVESWNDPWASWLHRALVKIPAGLDEDVELLDGAAVLARAAALCPDAPSAELLGQSVVTMRTATLPAEVRLAAATDIRVEQIMQRWPLREFVTSSGPWPLLVQRRRALVGAWYEFFPRSEGALSSTAAIDPTKSGTFATAARRLPAIAEMGFDVVYLPPIHPIGRTHRKGANNALVAAAADPGSPWAIGSADGGHDAVHPDLGTLADFDAFVATAKGLDLEVALDLALQASPDHPWVRTHPEWFTTRADGSVAYAENPPKKYQDIYPLNFDSDPEGLYREVERVVRHWMDHGVRIFRVDNPHTKPLWVWERLIASINATDPDVLFLAEAFTRPPMMQALAQVGFQQSYTYFTWRNGRYELEEYCRELAGPAASYMRPNFFANTPDILNDYLQHGGPAAFSIRATLAATLSPTYGIYSGFELYEHVALRPGSEEYLDSEKYQYRPRDWEAARRQGRTLAPYLALLNSIRRAHPALQDLRSLRFHQSDNPSVIAFAKQDRDDVLLVVCSVDPHREQEATIWWDMPALGMDWSDRFIARDLVSQTTWTWSHGTYVRLRPWEHVAHIVQVQQ